MCGILGVASEHPVEKRGWFPGAIDALRHRGPDGTGEWWSPDLRVGLGHTRLAVLDLSPTGRQPMHLKARGLSIVFNGEIYNFRELREELEHRGYDFHSRTDTEVLLAGFDAWGMECLGRINGAFAFALFDARQQQLHLGRDRAGEKPLFYHLAHGVIHFASELKALLMHPDFPRCIDMAALDCYLAMGFVPGSRCILQRFCKLPPGHALSFDLNRGSARVWRYWSLPEPAPNVATSTVDESALLNELEFLLEDAVGKQLVADVPVGILLSGGVDSSLVTAMAVRRSSKVCTYTIGFPGHGRLDETEHARLIARSFGTKHTELVAEPTTADLIPRLARQFDEPIADSSMIPMWLVSHLVRQHCTVVLGGDGGDELFGGYGHHSRLLQLSAVLSLVPGVLRKLVALAAERLLPLGFAASNVRTWLMASGGNLNRGLPLITSYFDATTRRTLMSQYPSHSLVAEGVHSDRVPRETDLLQRVTRMDFNDYMAEDILVKVDRASMLNSLEVRAPMLDYRLIEFAFGKVPSHLKATSAARKILLKRLTAKVLPAGFDRQRKQGFSIPLSQWLKVGPFRDLFWDVPSDSHCMFDSSTVHDLMRGQDRGRRNEERLFALVQFELWRREYRVSA